MLIKRLPSDEDSKQFREKLNRIVKKYDEGYRSSNLIGISQSYRELII